jgi:hypothetical protein
MAMSSQRKTLDFDREFEILKGQLAQAEPRQQPST